MASIHKRENGTYYVRYRENGQNKSKSGFRTKKDANRWIMEKERGEIQSYNITFDRLKKEYLEYRQNSVRNTSLKSIRNALDRWRFGRIDSITSLEIEKQFYDMPYAYKTKRNTLAALGACLRFGKRKYGTPNVIDEVKVRNPEEKASVKDIITADQLHQLLDIEPNPMNKLIYKLLFLSGIRIGEALALKYDDITDSYIDINKTVNQFGQITLPKTKSSYRKVFLPKEFLQELKNYVGNSDKYLFANKNGNTLMSNQISNILRQRSKEIGFKVTPHTFRHSCASFLISQGLPITAVSKHLGHSSPAVTMSVYAHMIPSDDDKKIEILSNIFNII